MYLPCRGVDQIRVKVIHSRLLKPQLQEHLPRLSILLTQSLTPVLLQKRVDSANTLEWCLETQYRCFDERAKLDALSIC